MKNCYLFLSAILLPYAASGQISLTSGMAPPIGSMFIYYDANVPSAPFTFSKSGISNTWDFTTISPLPTEEDTTFIEDPATVPGGSAFPTATHSTREHDTPVNTMLQITSSAAFFLGGVGDVLGTGTPISTVVNPPMVAMPFPYTYGMSGTGTGSIDIYATGAQIGQPTIDSIHYKSTITADRAMLAAGNIVVPSGTFPALLERTINTSVDSAWIKGAITLGLWIPAPGFPTTTTDSTFNWYSDQSLQKYAHAIYDDTGLSDVVFFKSSTTGLPAIAGNQQFTIYPNPATSEIHFGGAAHLQEMQLHLYDINGKEIYNQFGKPDQMDISMLQHGVYLLRVTSEGKDTTFRLVKN